MDKEAVASLRGLFGVVSVLQLASQAGIRVGYKGKNIVVQYAGSIRIYEDDDLGTVGLRFQLWLRNNHPMCSGGCLTPVANWAGAYYNFANLIKAAGKIVNKQPNETYADFVSRAAAKHLDTISEVKSFDELAKISMTGGTLSGVYSLPGPNHKKFASTIDPTKIFGDLYITSPLDFDWLLQGKEEPITFVKPLSQENPDARLFAELKCLRDKFNHNTTLVALAKKQCKKPEVELECLARNYYKRFQKFILAGERARRAIKGRVALKVDTKVYGPDYMNEAITRAGECLLRLDIEYTEDNARDLALFTCFKDRNLALDGAYVYYTYGKDCSTFESYEHYVRTVGRNVSAMDKMLMSQNRTHE